MLEKALIFLYRLYCMLHVSCYMRIVACYFVGSSACAGKSNGPINFALKNQLCSSLGGRLTVGPQTLDLCI